MRGRYSWLVRAAFLGSVLSVAAGSAVAQSALDQACAGLSRKSPELKGRALVVGVSPASANYSATDPANPENIIGVEPDLLRAAANCLGFSFTYSRLDFPGLIPALQSGRIQIIAAGMYASDERAKQVSFVTYMRAGEASIVRAGNPKKLESIADVCDVTAAEALGTVENAILDKQSDVCRAAGKSPITPLTFQSTDRAYSALAQGRADIVLTDSGVASFLAARTPDKVQVGFAIPSDFVFGFGVSKQDRPLLDALLGSLKAQHDDGSMAALLKKWGFDQSQSIEPTIKTQ